MGKKRKKKKRYRLQRGIQVGVTVALAGDCQAVTAAGRRCSRRASIQLGGRSLCEQHAYAVRQD